LCPGGRVLAREASNRIQQGHVGTPAAKRVQTDKAAPIVLSSTPRAIRRKEEVLAPDVTPANPLERLLNGESDGLTTPFVNGIQSATRISSMMRCRASWNTRRAPRPTLARSAKRST
jgi:hypothetical protein